MYYLIRGCFPENEKVYVYVSKLNLKKDTKYLITDDLGYNYRDNPFTVIETKKINYNFKANREIVKAIAYPDCAKPCVSANYSDSISQLKNSAAKKNQKSPIKNIWFSDKQGITVVQWKDGSKTKVTCSDKDQYHRETGVAMCALKKLYGSYSMNVDLSILCGSKQHEHKEPTVLTSFEHEVLKRLKAFGLKYIARDNHHNSLYAYEEKPRKGNICWSGKTGRYEIDDWLECFHFVKWDEDEPYSVEELLKCKVKG